MCGGFIKGGAVPPMSAFYPQAFTGKPTEKKESDKDRADRYENALKQMRDLPLPQRVSYVYMGIIKDALEPKATK